MEDIAPDLLEKIKSDFQKQFENDKTIADLAKKLEAGTAKHMEAYSYAGRVGTILTEVYQRNLSTDTLPDGKLWYNIANRVITPTMQNNYDIIEKYVSDVQANLNRATGIGIKPIKPKLNTDRIKGIVKKVSNADTYDDVSWVMNEPVKNFSQSIVDDSIKENVEFHGKSGMQPKIIRRSSGKCCEWCNSIAGIYQYPNVPKDVYRRHERCDCIIEYDPGNGKYQNVHTKQWRIQDNSDIIKNRKKIGIPQETLSINDIQIFKSIGARSNNYNIIDPTTGEIFHFVEGTKIQNAQVFAGKNVKTPLRPEVAIGLSEQIGGKPLNWQHCKGIGIIDYYNEERIAEVHWFQEESVGKTNFKIKRWLDEG